MSKAEFINGLTASIDGIAQMGLLVLIGYLIVRRKWISNETLTDLIRILIDVVVPCTLILAMARTFTVDYFRQSLIPATIGTAWILAAWLFGWVWFRFFPGDTVQQERSVTAMMMVSNTIYLPLPVILAVTPPELRDPATVYISITAIPSIILMWTVCVLLLAGSKRPTRREQVKMMLNAPILSLIFGILLTFIPGIREAARMEPGSSTLLKTLFSVMNHVNGMFSPLAMMILGGLIAASRGTGRPKWRYVVPLVSVRLILVPATVYLLLRCCLPPLPAPAHTILILVSATPSAVNHSLASRRYNGEWELVSALQLVIHIAALFTLPLWLSLGLAPIN